MPNHPSDKTAIVGQVPIAVTTPDRAVDWFIESILDRDAKIGPLRFLNAYCIALADIDIDYKTTLLGPGINFPDGAPVAWLARRQHRDAQQVRGPAFFEQAIRRGAPRGIRHYFFGTDQATLDQLRFAIQRIAPRATIAGMAAPPMGSVEEIATEHAARSILSDAPDVVWLGLGTPKQDHVGLKLTELLDPIPCVSVGAAFDFLAGTKSEAPEIMTKLGLEWLFRLASEPKRLWRRYFWGNSHFLSIVARHYLQDRSIRR